MTYSVRRPIRVAVLLTLVVVAVLLLATAVAASPSDAPTSERFVTHRVEAGDTLWDIAAEHTAPGDDVRRTIFEIKQANDLEGSIIHPGQDLRIAVG